MTIQEAARQALAVQDACNLSGVAISFRAVVDAVWEEARRLGKGTQWVNHHPICLLFIDKMFDLVRRPDIDDYSRATRHCEAIVCGESADYEQRA